MEKKLWEAKKFYREEFQDKKGDCAVLPLVLEDFKRFPFLRERGFVAMEVVRVGKALKVKFI
jgi:hypothetical protein